MPSLGASTRAGLALVLSLVLSLALGALGGCAETRLAVHAAKEIVKRDRGSPEKTARRTPKRAKNGAPLGQGGVYKVGDPYQVEGVRYRPEEDPDYSLTGIASWYGRPFHGRRTANGETYDMNALTAAHKTLPMPVYVRVTNLVNGRSLVLRVNDRGPFVNGRIIDVSRRAAQLLGFIKQGTARVRVDMVDRGGKVRFAAKPITSEAEKRAVKAAPQKPVAVAKLLPAKGVPVAPKIAEDLPPSVRLEAVKPTRIYIQAGAFSKYQNADRLRSKLSPLGQVSISSVQVKGRKFFRVRLGPLESLPLADQALANIIAEGHSGARIVVD
jgi:rare lipoprotein A